MLLCIGCNNSALHARAKPNAESEPAPVTTSETMAADSEANQRRILAACPHATQVRTFHGWLGGGRVVMKGQTGIRIVALDTVDDRTVTKVKPVSVFDVTQAQELAHRAA